MTHITITEQDSFADSTTSAPRPRGLRRAAVLGAFALGGFIGAVAGFSAADGGSSAAVVPASTPTSSAGVSAIVHDAHFGSADAAARRVEAERQLRIESCTSSPRSADSLERCLLGPDFDH